MIILLEIVQFQKIKKIIIKLHPKLQKNFDGFFAGFYAVGGLLGQVCKPNIQLKLSFSGEHKKQRLLINSRDS